MEQRRIKHGHRDIELGCQPSSSRRAPVSAGMESSLTILLSHTPGRAERELRCGPIQW